MAQDYVIKKESSNRDGKNSSLFSQDVTSSGAKAEESKVVSSRSGEKTTSDNLQTEKREQIGSTQSISTRSETGKTSSKSEQLSEGERNGSSERGETRKSDGTTSQEQESKRVSETITGSGGTSKSSGSETAVEYYNIGARVTFVVKIRGGLGTVPAGSDAPASPCGK